MRESEASKRRGWLAAELAGGNQNWVFVANSANLGRGFIESSQCLLAVIDHHCRMAFSDRLR